MTAAAEGARKVADFLRGHPGIASVWYLGFLTEDLPIGKYSNANAPRRLDLRLRDQGRRGRSIPALDNLEVITCGEFGRDRILASHPAAMTHSDIPPEEQMRLGITPALIRLSVGASKTRTISSPISTRR